MYFNALLRKPCSLEKAMIISVFSYWFYQAVIAQLGERQTEDLKVPGSIPAHSYQMELRWRLVIRVKNVKNWQKWI